MDSSGVTLSFIMMVMGDNIHAHSHIDYNKSHSMILFLDCSHKPNTA